MLYILGNNKCKEVGAHKGVKSNGRVRWLFYTGVREGFFEEVTFEGEGEGWEVRSSR